ncbi:hypothetical protein BDB00DRAFT_820913 [Zychaea mexicana]|uniref:uncharacterized protein n=1 Tax=Zychaea mexicana TaxID=64656 RepID=UPI0022FF34FF|nr:uncharacterized protein BDB00DRAFT_820913 [Zychaea mexicana]KAI9494106.1 hypothetical protein BDB00DRAFT_820913 [Zychaea mexicana]
MIECRHRRQSRSPGQQHSCNESTISFKSLWSNIGRGFRCTLFGMDLIYQATYRPVPISVFFIPQDHHDFCRLPKCYAALTTMRSLVLPNADRCFVLLLLSAHSIASIMSLKWLKPLQKDAKLESSPPAAVSINITVSKVICMCPFGIASNGSRGSCQKSHILLDIFKYFKHSSIPLCSLSAPYQT